MRKFLILLALAAPLGATGCAAWLGQYEPGVRFKLNPITKTLEFENTTDTSVSWDLLEARFGDSSMWVEGFEAEHSASAVAAQIGQQMAMAVESQRVGGQQILDGLAIGLNTLGPALAGRINPPPTTQPAGPSRLDRIEAMLERLLAREGGP